VESSTSDREQDVPGQPASPIDELGARVVIDVGRLLWDSDSETVPDFLWHYTDGAGALGILEGCALWATHALFMNDASELRLAYPLLEEALRIAEERQEGNEILRLVAAALSVMVSPTAQERDPEIYAVCFCEDGDLLSQWRGYGMVGTGYSIGMDGTSLQRSGMTTIGLSLAASSMTSIGKDRWRKS
jgi:hypothetical protein